MITICKLFIVLILNLYELDFYFQLSTLNCSIVKMPQSGLVLFLVPDLYNVVWSTVAENKDITTVLLRTSTIYMMGMFYVCNVSVYFFKPSSSSRGHFFNLSSACLVWHTWGAHQHNYLSKHEGSWWSGRVAVMKNIKTISQWETSAAAVIQHMAHPRLLEICFTGVTDISTTISLIDVVKYAPFISEL